MRCGREEGAGTCDGARQETRAAPDVLPFQFGRARWATSCEQTALRREGKYDRKQKGVLAKRTRSAQYLMLQSNAIIQKAHLIVCFGSYAATGKVPERERTWLEANMQKMVDMLQREYKALEKRVSGRRCVQAAYRARG